MRKKNGFTMVELLGVISILAVIILIAIPTFGAVRERTNQSVYESKVASVKAAAEAYSEESGKMVFDIRTLISEGKLEADNESGEYLNPVNGADMRCYVVDVRYENLQYYANVHESSDCMDESQLESLYGAIKVIAYNKEKTLKVDPAHANWYKEPVVITYELSETANYTSSNIVRINWQGDRNISCSKEAGDLENCRYYGTDSFGTEGTVSNLHVVLEITFQNDQGVEFTSRTSKLISVDMESPSVEITPSLGSTDQSGKRVDLEMTDGNGSGLLEYKMVKVDSETSPLPVCKDLDGYKQVTQNKMIEYKDNGVYYTCIRDRAGNDNQATLENTKTLVSGVDYSRVDGIVFEVVSTGESTPMKVHATITVPSGEDTSKLKMCISNQGFLSNCSWEPYQSEFDWELEGDADCNNRTIYLSISDEVGHITNLVSNGYAPSNTVKYEADGGTFVNSGDAKKIACYDGNYPTPTISKVGHSFDGWYTQASGGEKITNTTKVQFNGVKTLFAHWNVNNYYLDLNGLLDGSGSGNINGYGTADVYINGSAVSTGINDYYAQHPYGTRYEIKNIKATTGHTYNGVSSGSASGTIGAGNVITQLKFTTNSYTVTWNGNGATSVTNGATSVKYNNNVGTLGTASRTGYTFAGWFTAASGGAQISTTTKVTGNVTYYAHWNVNKYYIDLNGLLDGTGSGNISGFGTADVYINGSKVSTGVNDYCAEHPYGTKYEFKNIKATTGHTYNGVSSGSLSGTVGTARVTTQLKFTTNSYTVTWNGNGGSVTKNGATSVKYNNNVGTLGTASRSGFTFLGWFTAASGGAQISTTTKVTGNVTYYAHWKQDFPSSHCILGAGYIQKIVYKDEKHFRIYFNTTPRLESDANLYIHHYYERYQSNGDIDLGTNASWDTYSYNSPYNHADISDSVVDPGGNKPYTGSVFLQSSFHLSAGTWEQNTGYESVNGKLQSFTYYTFKKSGIQFHYGNDGCLDMSSVVTDSDASNYGGLSNNAVYGTFRKHYLTDRKIKIKCNHGIREYTMTYMNW